MKTFLKWILKQLLKEYQINKDRLLQELEKKLENVKDLTVSELKKLLNEIIKELKK